MARGGGIILQQELVMVIRIGDQDCANNANVKTQAETHCSKVTAVVEK